MQGYGKCIRQESCQAITWTGHPESRFTFDIVADENVSQVSCLTWLCFIFIALFFTFFWLAWVSFEFFHVQEQLFKVAGLAMVDNCMIGYNSCMFAYGQVSLQKLGKQMFE